MDKTFPGWKGYPPSYCLIMTLLTRMGEPKSVFGRNVAWLGQEGDPTITKG